MDMNHSALFVSKFYFKPSELFSIQMYSSQYFSFIMYVSVMNNLQNYLTLLKRNIILNAFKFDQIPL